MNKAFFDEVRDTFVRINTMENVRAVVLQAEGRLFSAGLDLKEMGSLFSSGESEGNNQNMKILRDRRLRSKAS